MTFDEFEKKLEPLKDRGPAWYEIVDEVISQAEDSIDVDDNFDFEGFVRELEEEAGDLTFRFSDTPNGMIYWKEIADKLIEWEKDIDDIVPDRVSDYGGIHEVKQPLEIVYYEILSAVIYNVGEF